MRFESKLAWRYFRARRSKSAARFTAIVAVVGIAAGVASLIVAQSLARGFSDEMRDKILANTAHVSVFSTAGAEISDWRLIKEKLEKIGNVETISATVYENAVIAGNKTIDYAILRSTENARPAANDEKSKTENRSPKIEDQKIEVSLGKELAEKCDLKIGDAAKIITFFNGSQPQTSEVYIQDIFQTGLYEYDAIWIRIAPEDFARLKKQTNFAPTVLSVSLKDIYLSNKTADEIRQKIGDRFRVVDWQEANQPLFAALSLERRFALAVISLIVFIAALNITTTLALLVNERRLDIAVLRTCGATTKNLIFVFLFEGLLLGIIGIFGGVILGLLGCCAGNYFKIINLSKEVYSLSFVPLRPTAEMILLVVSISFLLCLMATVYPAWKASRIKPLENLRNH